MKETNVYDRYMGAEDHLQHQLITWLAFQYPKLKYHHSPDAGKRTPFERYKYTYLGSDSGFPDLIFPEIRTAIELKIKPNKPTPAQNEWLDHFREIGWNVSVCYSLFEAQKVINENIKS